MESVDLLIVGAGWHGLAMAKTYHELYPDSPIAVLDSAESIGGSWALERIYPGLKTNNLLGSYEFSDFPMIPERYDVRHGEHIPGIVVHRYLCDAAEYFEISQYFHLRTKVDASILQEDGSWLADCTATRESETRQYQLRAAKMVVATGLTSEPHIPHFEGSQVFRGLSIHSKQLKSHAIDLASASDVVVIGGNKSAWDVCYRVASSGRRAYMIIRPGGAGPSWVWPAALSPFAWSLSGISKTRAFCLFDPWPFSRQKFPAWIAQILHRSVLGRWVVKAFWSCLGSCVRRINKYADHAHTQRLDPWASTFWMGNSLSTHNYETDYWHLVKAGSITVHVADIDHLTHNEVYLDDGTTILADAVVHCTGWKVEPSLRILHKRPDGTSSLLWSPPISDERAAALCEEHLFGRPMLNEPPRLISSETKHESLAASTRGFCYSLYRFMISPRRELLPLRNLAFIGMYQSLHTVILAQAQALWISAFFNDQLTHVHGSDVDFASIQLDTESFAIYERLRRPKIGGGGGARFPDLVFDSIPYVDLLLTDLGLQIHRKKSTFANWFQPASMADYRDLSKEWHQTHSQRSSSQR